jgi:valyl-tRNA synthetase
MTVEDKWILSRLGSTIKETTALLDEFKFNEPLNSVYRFFWNDLCDWYLEWAKPRMQDAEQKPIAQNILAYVLDQTLRLLHPFIPFITEGMFQKLNEIAPVRKLEGIADVGASEAIIVAKWPEAIEEYICEKTENDIEIIQSAIKAIREVRSQYNIAPKIRLKASVKTSGVLASILDDNKQLLCRLAGLDDFAAGEGLEKPSKAASAIIDEMQIFVHDVIDPEEERKRLDKQKQQIENGLRSTEGKLNNENFVSRAKPEVVEQARLKLKEFQDQLAAIEKHISEIED